MKMIALLLAALLCSCSDEGPTAPTAEEADQLNEAEAMLNGEVTEDTPP